MTQPETWKELASYASKAWSAVGPLVGILIGAWLARSSDRKRWLADNRKEECRELVRSISHASALALDIDFGRPRAEADEAYIQTVQTFKDRIFIADDIAKKNLLDLWADAVKDYGAGRINRDEFSDAAEKSIRSVVDLVVEPRKSSG